MLKHLLLAKNSALILICILALSYSDLPAQGFSATRSITAVATSASSATGEKPQSKVWSYGGKWWSVFPSGNNTILWMLNNGVWTSQLTLTSGNAYADCKVFGNQVHIILFKGSSSELVSLEFLEASGQYQLWSGRPANVAIALDASVETATIEIDTNGRIWLASDANTTANVRWSDPPYTTWSDPAIIATGIQSDDICSIIFFNGRIGVIWSNQNTRRYGFKSIAIDSDPSIPANWSADEIPASQSAINQGGGMADDHLNIKASSDGSLFCAVKTSYDNASLPRIGLLVRRANGNWDNLHDVGSALGTRPIIIINDSTEKLKVFYTAQDGGGSILYKESSIHNISFGNQITLISGNYNNVTSAKENYQSEIVILASSASQVVGIVATDAVASTNPDENSLIGNWKFDTSTGPTVVDSSNYANNGTAIGGPQSVAGPVGKAMQFNGSSQYITVPNSSSLNISASITLAAWIRPQSRKTQYIIRKGNQGSANGNGYELSLANGGEVFFRINQQANGNTYRVDSRTLYPTNGTEWMHIAGIYDGQSLKIYINGVLENTISPAPTTIMTNTLPLAIGAQSDGAAASRFHGSLDEVRIYNAAVSESQILSMATRTPLAPELSSPLNNQINVSLSPTVSWNPVVGAASYGIQISSTEDFSSVDYEATGLSSTTSTFTGLSKNTTYYWRVRASNSFEHGPWSGVWSFTTMNNEPAERLVGHWRFEETDEAVVIDSSPMSNTGVTVGNPLRTTGITGKALNLTGPGQYASVPDHSSLDISNQITLAAWVKPERVGTQYIIRKGIQSSGQGTGVDGYELSLSNPGNVFFRINQASYGDTYRVNSTIVHPSDGNTWLHIAGTYDGQNLRIYINGVLNNTITPDAPISISTNNLPLTIGAQSSGSVSFDGDIDDARVYDMALSEMEIQQLIAATLPVKLQSFIATDSREGIQLSWQTLTEDNNKGFYIERSSNGTDFTAVGFVTSKGLYGNSSTIQHYSFLDNTTLDGVIYYRLKQVDRDDNYMFSKIILTRPGTKLDVQKFFPNPATNQFNIMLRSEVDTKTEILVYNISGNLVSRLIRNISVGSNSIPLDLSPLKPGNYIVRIISPDKKLNTVIRFLKTK